MDGQKEFEKLQKLLAAYGDAESIQEPQEAPTDSQLNSLALVIEEVLHSARPEMVIFPNLFVGQKKLWTFIYLR